MAMREEQMCDRAAPRLERGDVHQVREYRPKSSASTAMVSRTVFTQHRITTLRAGAVFLYVISVTGAAIWGGGGVSAWLALSPNWVGLGLSLALQGILSWLQFIYSDRPFSFPYIGSLLVSSGTTLAGYLPLVLAMLALAGIPVGSFWGVFSIVATIVACGSADIVPERTLLGK